MGEATSILISLFIIDPILSPFSPRLRLGWVEWTGLIARAYQKGESKEHITLTRLLYVDTTSWSS